MEGIKEGFEVFDNGTQCINHPHRNSPGGICAFCLQEKLGKLVSSSFPLPTHPSSSSSSSTPSFRSHHTAATSSSSSSLPLSAPQKNHSHHHDHGHGSRLPFLLAKKKKKPSCSNPSSSTSDVVFKRSKSTATPRMGKFLNEEDFSPRKKNKFWSFLYLSSSKHSASCSSKFEAKSFSNSNGSPRISTLKHKDKNNFGSSLGRKSDMVMVVEEDNVVVVSPNNGHSSSLDRKVSRSRSVGCGSRSFSGDFFERISTGLGDCTLRRVESQREGSKSKVGSASHCMKERVRCGGLFGGFMMMTSSSTSSSSASSYWISSSSADDGINGDSLSHGKGRSWGWTLASPMRAFSSKNSSKDNKRGSSGKNPTPNLSAIPSLLTVRS